MKNKNAFDYEKARKDFNLTIPDCFNFAFDIVSKQAQSRDKIALIALDKNGQDPVYHKYSDLDQYSI